jgi:ribosomal protein S18 acetylase RimI-like enzyme
VALEKIDTPEDVSFRPIRPADEPFLARLYASTRADEMAVVPWSEEQKASFLQMQFEAQHKFYLEQFQQADFLIVQRRGQPIGRLYLDHRVDEIRLIDIALLPEHRQKGLGAALMRDVLAAARRAGKKVRIHVERNNPAMRLYHRLGFERIEDQGPYYLMEWSPPGD